MRLTSWFFIFVVGAAALAGGAFLASELLSVSAPPRALIANIGATRLQFPSPYWRYANVDSQTDRIDLIALAPDFRPGGNNPRALPGPGKSAVAGKNQIFLTLVPAEGPDPVERPVNVYGRFLDAEVREGPDGLMLRRFEAGTPYENEDLYISPPDGRDFAARCSRQPSPGDGLPDTCLVDFRVEGVDAQMRFSAEILGQWRILRENAARFVAGAILR